MRFGMDYGGTNLKTGIFDEDGRLTKFEEHKLAEFLTDGDLLENLLNFTQKFIKGYTIHRGGLAIKGLVDSINGMLMEDIGAGDKLAGRNLAMAFENFLGFPFILENDARAYAIGEWQFGAGRGMQTIVCMTLGTGLGCAAIVDGKPYRGDDVFGGLLGGHLSIDRNGPECVCGQRGCLELYCSSTAFNQRIKANHPELAAEADALPSFFKKLTSGMPQYTNTLKAFQDDLAIGIVNIIHAFNPGMVIIGGGVMNSAEVILPRLIEIVDRRAWTWPRGKVKIRASVLSNKAAALGVAFHPEFRM